MLAVVALCLLAVLIASLPLMVDWREGGRSPANFALKRDLSLALLLGLGVSCVVAPALRMLLLSEGESHWFPVVGISLGIGLSAAAAGTISRYRYTSDLRDRHGDVDGE